MQMESHKKGVDVIEYGKTGDLFYMILDGSVEVWQPDQTKIKTYSDVVSQVDMLTTRKDHYATEIAIKEKEYK